MANFARNLAGDIQTMVLALGGAAGGAVSEKVGTMIITGVRGSVGGSSLGDRGLNFIIRAGVAGVAFDGLASLMPETSSNLFFGIVFFAANRSLVNEAVGMADQVVSALFGAIGMENMMLRTNRQMTPIGVRQMQTMSDGNPYYKGPVIGGPLGKPMSGTDCMC